MPTPSEAYFRWYDTYALFMRVQYNPDGSLRRVIGKITPFKKEK